MNLPELQRYIRSDFHHSNIESKYYLMFHSFPTSISSPSPIPDPHASAISPWSLNSSLYQSFDNTQDTIPISSNVVHIPGEQQVIEVEIIHEIHRDIIHEVHIPITHEIHQTNTLLITQTIKLYQSSQYELYKRQQVIHEVHQPIIENEHVYEVHVPVTTQVNILQEHHLHVKIEEHIGSGIPPAPVENKKGLMHKIGSMIRPNK